MKNDGYLSFKRAETMRSGIAISAKLRGNY